MRLRTGLAFMLLGMTTLSAQRISHPETLAGRWETSDGQGGQVGMNILITTTVPNSPSTILADLPQTVQDFEIGLYQRKASDVEPLGFKFFTTSPSGGATWDGRHLRIDLQREIDRQNVHIDLSWNEAAAMWTGSFQAGGFQDAAIALKRPSHAPASPFAGTWFEITGPFHSCLHIVQAQDGTFTAWGDILQLPGQQRYANGLRPPPSLMQHYGQIAKVRLPGPDRVEAELGAYTGMCCSHTFAATLSPDGNSLTGNWPPGMNQAPRPAMWRRVEGDSCTATVDRH